jgi:hypothetical protein
MTVQNFPGDVAATDPTDLVGTNGSAAARAPVSPIGLALLNAADKPAGRAAIDAAVAPSVTYEYFEPFLNATTGLGMGLTSTVTGGTNAAQAVDNRQGVVRQATGTATTADRIAVISNAAAAGGPTVSVGAGALLFAENASVITAPDGTATGNVMLGFFDVATSATPTDAVMFRATNAGNWFAVCRSNNVETATDLGVAPAIGTYRWFVVSVNAAGTSAVFTIYNEAGGVVATATVTTNIPNGAGRQVGFGSRVHRVAAVATNIALDVDGIFFRYTYNTALPF